MLSRHAIRRPHRGQVDGGWNSERCFLSSLASRRIQTLRKLPRQSPRSPAPTSRIGSATTRHLVEQDTRRYRDVEGLGALCQRDRHPLRGDGVELRADSRPLVSDDNGNGSVHPSRSSLSLPRSSARCRGTPSAALAHSVTPCFLAQAMKPASSSDTTGWRKVARSEERRVGKECRSRWSPYH